MNFTTKIKKIIIFLILFCLIFSFTACDNQTYSYDFYAFNNTPILIETKDKELSNETITEIRNLLIDLENKFSATKENSFTSSLNFSNANLQIEMDADEKYILDKCKNYYNLTNYKFNPAIYPLVKLWHFSPLIDNASFVPPSDENINQILNSGEISMDNFIINENYIYKTKSNSEIDFGGIVKGYACEKIYDILLRDDIQKGFVSVGGSSIKLISIDSLSIKHPRDKNNIILKIKTNLSTCAISTSGDYERFYTYNGKNYSHIIDGQTGKSYETGIISATVISSDSTFCDAMSTAVCLSTFDKDNLHNDLYSLMHKIIDSGGDNTCIYAIYNKNNEKYIITNKIETKDFSLLDSSYSIINI